ncbi:MAG: glycosyltransferase family 2 protein [Deltaproteobacteria bacterium]|nr:glycosyltransferase family 2 protein [Deltaproteobacteria bacterium]
MSQLSVVIFTFNRPAFLREALESVARQTARSAITELIVSENSEFNESRAVCEEFRDRLPIVWVQQRPPVSPLHHLPRVWGQIRCPTVALLHDDDWWAPNHLEAALKVLDCQPDCTASYSSYFLSVGPRHWYSVAEVAWFVWLSSGCNFENDEAVFLDEAGVMSSCLLNASLHYSTLVGRTEAIGEAYARVVATENPFDTDRVFPVLLRLLGPIAYQTAPDTFVRVHAGQDSMQPRYTARGFALLRDTDRWLLQTYPAVVSEAAKRFNEAASRLKGQDHVLNYIWGTAHNRIKEPHWSTLVRECGFDLRRLAPGGVLGGRISPESRRLVWGLLPPLLFESLRQLAWRAVAFRREQPAWIERFWPGRKRPRPSSESDSGVGNAS